MRSACAVTVLLLANAIAASAQTRELFIQMLKGPGAVESLAQELWMKQLGAKMCKIEEILPTADMATIFDAMKAVDAEGVQAAHDKALIMIRGLPLPLTPGGPGCAMVADKIKGAVVLYGQLAATARQ